MKQFISFCICNFFILSSAFCQEDVPVAAAVEKAETKQMNIKAYWFVMLTAGKKYDMDSTAKAKLMKGHMENIGRLHEEGILKVAGPFGKNDLKWKGIFILDCKSKEEALKHIMTDPAVSAGVLDAKIVQWYTEPSGSFTPGEPEKN